MNTWWNALSGSTAHTKLSACVLKLCAPPPDVMLNSARRTCAPGYLRSQLNSATLDEMASWAM